MLPSDCLTRSTVIPILFPHSIFGFGKLDWKITTQQTGSPLAEKRKDAESALICFNMATTFHWSVASGFVSKETNFWVSRFCIHFPSKSIKLLDYFHSWFISTDMSNFSATPASTISLKIMFYIWEMLSNVVQSDQSTANFSPCWVTIQCPFLHKKPYHQPNPTVPYEMASLQWLWSTWHFITFFEMSTAD